MLPIVAAILTLLIVATATYTDIRYRRIFNALTYSGVVTGLALNATGGVRTFLQSVEGVLMGVGLLIFVAFCGHILGGGDIKLLMAIGALQGPVFLGWALLYTALAGGVLALAVSLYRGVLRQAMRRVGATFYMRFALNEPMGFQETGKGARLPYAIAIGAGTMVGLCVLRPW